MFSCSSGNYQMMNMNVYTFNRYKSDNFNLPTERFRFFTNNDLIFSKFLPLSSLIFNFYLLDIGILIILLLWESKLIIH